MEGKEKILFLTAAYVMFFMALAGISFQCNEKAYPTDNDVERMEMHNAKLVEKIMLVNKDWSKKALLDYASFKEGTKND